MLGFQGVLILSKGTGLWYSIRGAVAVCRELVIYCIGDYLRDVNKLRTRKII